jgi:hypothetical protein
MQDIKVQTYQNHFLRLTTVSYPFSILAKAGRILRMKTVEFNYQQKIMYRKHKAVPVRVKRIVKDKRKLGKQLLHCTYNCNT